MIRNLNFALALLLDILFGRLLVLLCTAHPHHYPGRYHPQTGRKTLSVSRIAQTLAGGPENGGGPDDTCSVCGNINGNYTLRPDILPLYPLPSGSPDEEPIPDGLTCQSFEEYAQNFAPEDPECYLVQTSFLNECCDTPPLHECETTLRKKLLEDYDPVIPPGPPKNKRYVDIEFFLEFFHITGLDIQTGTVEIFVWVTMLWQDERLAWDPTEQCAFQTTFRASLDAEKTEIWVPDIDLYNHVDGGLQKMPDAAAEVFPDGTVLWRRNGGLRAGCNFAGLRRIPFDTLGCRYMFGGWTRHRTHLNLHLSETDENMDAPGFSRDVYYAKYAEYKLIAEMTKTGYMDKLHDTQYQYSLGVYYDFYFSRATRYYVTSIVVPAIVFTILSFGMFLLDLRVGERLSYGMALLLVLAANQIVISSLLPITNERLWIVVLINSSFYWVVIGLLESVLVGYLFFIGHEEEKDGPGRLLMRSGTPRSGEQANDVPEVIREQVGGDAEPTRTDRRDKEQISAFRQSMRSVFTLKQAMISRKGQGRNRHRELIRRIDRWSFRILPTTYCIFLIVLFASLPAWEERGEDLWPDPTGEESEVEL